MGHLASMEQMRYVRNVVRKRNGKEQLGRPRLRCRIIIIKHLKPQGYGLDSTGLGKYTMTSAMEHDYEA